MLKFATVALAATLFAVVPALAADHQIQMLNKGEAGAMVFEPGFVQAAPGDTITFVATDKGHNAETIAGMIPEGAEPFKSAFGQDFTVTVTEEGVYGVKCLPHFGMGMVALIQVGAPTNLDAAKAVATPPKAKERFDGYFAQVAN